MDKWYKKYRKHLQSEEWAEKKKYFKKDCPRLIILKQVYGQLICEICHTEAKFEVHHIHYNTLGFESYEDLLLLCEACHEEITRYAKSRGVSMAVATFILFRAYAPVRYQKLKQ